MGAESASPTRRLSAPFLLGVLTHTTLPFPPPPQSFHSAVAFIYYPPSTPFFYPCVYFKLSPRVGLDGLSPPWWGPREHCSFRGTRQASSTLYSWEKPSPEHYPPKLSLAPRDQPGVQSRWDKRVPTLSLCWGPGRWEQHPCPLLRVPGSCCWDLALVSWNPPRPRCPQPLPTVELRRALVKTEESLAEEQPSASRQLDLSSPKLLIHVSSVGSVWREKYLIQSTGKCSWKLFPGERERESACVCVSVVCTLPSFLPPPTAHSPRPHPRRACSPGPQAPTISFFATATGRG